MKRKTKNTFKKQNMVVVRLDEYSDYRKRSIMFYFILFGGIAFSYSLLYYVLTYFFKIGDAFFVSHAVSVTIIDASLIAWVLVNLYLPIPIPQERGVTQKVIVIMCLYVAILFLIFFLYFHSNVDWVNKVLFFSIGGGFLYGFTAAFAVECEQVHKRTYFNNSIHANSKNNKDFLHEIVFNPIYNNFECNVWHDKDRD